MNYHIGRLVLSSLCALEVLQPAKRTPPNISHNKSSNTQRTEKKTTDVVIHQHSRKLLMMDIIMSETCWAHKKWNKIASDIKLVIHSSTITMMHGPINISLLKVLCPVSRPITTLVWVLLRDNSRAPVAKSGPEISSRAHLAVLQAPRHNTICCFSIQRFKFLLIFCLETPKKGSGPTNRWAETLLASLSAISFPLTPACPGTQNSPTACRAEMSSKACWIVVPAETLFWQPEAASEPPDYQKLQRKSKYTFYVR